MSAIEPNECRRHRNDPPGEHGVVGSRGAIVRDMRRDIAREFEPADSISQVWAVEGETQHASASLFPGLTIICDSGL